MVLFSNSIERDPSKTVVVMLGGDEYAITIRDPALAAELTGLNGQKLDPLIATMGKGTRLLTKFWTQLNPYFLVKNMFRDFMQATVHMTGENGLKAGVQFGLPWKWSAAAAAYGKYESTGKIDTNTKWGRYLKEFMESGGQTGYVSLIKREERIQELDDMFKTASRGVMSKAFHGQWLKAAGEAVSILNGAVENATRLSAYAYLRDKGWSPEKAISYSKNITVNFNRRGDLGPRMNALWLFFNPSIQDTARIARFMKRAPKAAAGIMGSMAAMGFASALLSSMDEDEDGTPYWYKPQVEQQKQRNLVFVIPGSGGKFLTIPLPYGYMNFFQLGYALHDLMAGQLGRGKWKGNASVAYSFINSLSQSLLPLGGNFLDDPAALMPTLLQLPTHIIAGKDDFGGNLYPGGDQKPDSERMRIASRGTMTDATTKFLNSVSGGDPYIPGSIDLSPETIGTVVRWGFGGAGQFVGDVVNGAYRMAGGVPVDSVSDIPVLGKFADIVYKEHKPEKDIALYSDRASDLRKAKASYDAGMKSGKPEGKERAEDVKEMVGDRLLLELGGRLSEFDQKLKTLRDKQAEIQQDEDMSISEKAEAMKELDEKRGAIFRQFNEKFNELSEGKLKVNLPARIL
jgi:hypothetical protein